ncbi:MAG: PepSY domain-containing protein [Xanthomonadaceae bacterium]|jgi:hypothetical protein|nr:PepSY domain-containing protein [Xanthomonadaceae bacterium]MDE3073723.1 PepSY domain-containing protein [Pseudomonadota bacterium]
MTENVNFTLALLVSLWLGVAAPASAQPAQPLTLDQAVLKVRQQTGGTVLSAEPHRIGRRVEYRIKVLTPDGHVRVISVSAGIPHERSSPATVPDSPRRAVPDMFRGNPVEPIQQPVIIDVGHRGGL